MVGVEVVLVKGLMFLYAYNHSLLDTLERSWDMIKYLIIYSTLRYPIEL